MELGWGNKKFVGNFEWKTSCKVTRCRWEGNIKMDITR